MQRTQFEHSTNKDTMPGTGSNWEVHAHTQNTTQKKERQIERRSASLQGKTPDSVPHRESPPRPTRRSPSFPPERTESPRPHAGAPQKMRRTWRGMRRPWPQRSTPPRQRGRSDAPREWPPSAAWRACRCRLTYSHTKKKGRGSPPPPKQTTKTIRPRRTKFVSNAGRVQGSGQAPANSSSTRTGRSSLAGDHRLPHLHPPRHTPGHQEAAHAPAMYSTGSTNQ